jgi:hypothetical protein
MHGISIRAILIANVASLFIVALELLQVVVLSVLAAFVIALFPGNDIPVHEHAVINDVSSDIIVVIFVVSATTGAGYVAGRIAKARFLINGILGTALWTLLAIVPLPLIPDTSPSPELPHLLKVVLTCAAPVFGMLGGHLAKMRVTRLDAMPVERRPVYTFKSTLVALARWTLAFPIALAVYGISLIILLKIGASALSFVFAVVSAVVLGTAVVPRDQRRFGGIVFICLAMLIPAEEFVRHGLLGELAHRHGLYLGVHLLGAGMAYLALLSTFPEQFRVSRKWWWLSSYNYAAWTREERRVRMGLGLTGGITAILLFFVAAKLVEFMGIDMHYAAPAAMIFALPLGMWIARPIYSELYPQQIRQADANVSARLGPPV